jgi:hypothetical protein
VAIAEAASSPLLPPATIGIIIARAKGKTKGGGNVAKSKKQKPLVSKSKGACHYGTSETFERRKTRWACRNIQQRATAHGNRTAHTP